jgi:hypothetical protein
MRLTSTAVAAAVVSLSLAAACSDVTTPTGALAPSAPSYAAAPKVTICHAAGRAGTTHYIQLTLSANGLAGHFDNNGTPLAGHEQDYMGPCTVSTGTLTVCVVNGTQFGTGLGAVTFTGDAGAFGPLTIPDPGQPANCTSLTVSAGTYDITQSGPSDIWVQTVIGGTVAAGNIGSVSFAGQNVTATTTVTAGGTTTLTFVEQR